MMQIRVNGAPFELPEGSTVVDLLGMLDMAERRVAVEVNRAIVPRSQHPNHALTTDDRVEIVHAIGGG